MATIQAAAPTTAPAGLEASPRPPLARPRVLRVITRLNVGGPARQAIDLTARLRDAGYDTRLLSGSVATGEGELPAPAGLPMTSVPSLRRELGIDDVVAWRAIHGVIRRWRPDVVHTHMAKAGALGRSAAMRSGIPAIVHTFHGHVLQHYFSALRSEAFAATERALARRTHALLAVSGRVRDDLLAMGIGDERRWRVMPVGLDLEPLIRDRTPAPDARARLGLASDGPLVASVGRLTAIKDLGTLLRAVARLAATHPDVRLAIAGDGGLRASLEAEADRLLPGRVTFLGWCSELPTLYRAADVVASTSTMEGTPLSLIEASAAARPVVATDVGGVADVVVDGVSGTLVPRGDDVAIAAAIRRVLDDRRVAATMGDAGAAWVAPRFSRERLASDLASLYAELLDRPSLPSSAPSP